MPDNDPSIPGEAQLLRRIHPTQLVWDENQNRLRPTSNAFKDPSMSVNVEDDVLAMGEQIGWVLRHDPKHHLASITTAFARDSGQTVWRDPLVGDPIYGDDPTHAIVEGHKTGAQKSAYAKQAAVRVVRAASLSAELRERQEAAVANRPEEHGA